jgi:hypothetical protein
MVGAVKRFEERRMRNGFFVSNDAVRNLVVSCPQFTFMQLAVLDHGYYAVVWFCLSCFVLSFKSWSGEKKKNKILNPGNPV